MIMKNILKILVIGLMGMAVQSCYYDEVVPTFEDPIVIPPGTVITFKADIAPMFTPTCTACHAGGQAPDLRNTQTAYDNLIANAKLYVVKGNSAGSLLYNKIKNSDHYANLNATQLATLKAWIDSNNAKYE
jgi:hypothetical protein